MEILEGPFEDYRIRVAWSPDMVEPEYDQNIEFPTGRAYGTAVALPAAAAESGAGCEGWLFGGVGGLPSGTVHTLMDGRRIINVRTVRWALNDLWRFSCVPASNEDPEPTVSWQFVAPRLPSADGTTFESRDPSGLEGRHRDPFGLGDDPSPRMTVPFWDSAGVAPKEVGGRGIFLRLISSNLSASPPS